MTKEIGDEVGSGTAMEVTLRLALQQLPGPSARRAFLGEQKGYDRAVATFLCTDARFRQHRPAPGPQGEHPERPERLVAIEAALAASGLLERCVKLPARAATKQEILRAHTEAHLAELQQRMGDENPYGMGWLDPDTYYGPGSYEAALLAAGAAIDLALRVLQGPGTGKKDNGLALVRPPGHHATRDQAMGFCLLNNVAIAAAAAREQGARVAIVDFDVHHGNGTEDIFAAAPDVLFISLHQAPFYPGSGEASFTGTGAGQGSVINIPLPQGSGDEVYRRCFTRIVLPALARFAPDLLLVSAGFDAHQQDPLAGMSLSDAGYAMMGRLLLSAQPKLAAVLEGGYDLAALGTAVTAFVGALLGAAPGEDPKGQQASELPEAPHAPQAPQAPQAPEDIEQMLASLALLHRL